MIEVKHLTKTYGKFKAVDDISLLAKDGEITVLLGPNGAGKSTTIKSIANLLRYQGEIKIGGYANDTLEAKRILTIDEHVEFIGKAYRCEHYQERAEHYITMFDLSSKRKKLVKELSKGMRQKVSMLLALLIAPKALLVDEPMVGLDPASIEETLQLFQQLKEEGVAILISTHIIDVIDAIWDEAYIMNKGHIVAHVRKEGLQEQTLKELFFTSTQHEVGEAS